MEIDLSATITLGLAIGASASLLRALPWPEWLRSRKPLDCPTCLAWWGTIGVGIDRLVLDRSGSFSLVTLVAAAGVAELLLRILDKLAGPRSWPLPPPTP